MICAVGTVHECSSRGLQSTCSTVMWECKKNNGHCASRGSRGGHLHLNFLITGKLGHYLARDILCLSYGCVVFVLNWWYQMVLGRKKSILYTVTIFHADLYTYRARVQYIRM